MRNYIKGNYRRTIFKSDNGYVIGLFKIKDTNTESMQDYINKSVTFTGYFHDLNEDDTYIFYGEEVDHPRYGFQYQVSDYERVKPEDKEGIVEFLASDLFPGVGEKLAQTIVETLGEKTLERILEDESCLLLVPKLSAKKASKIYEILTKYEESHKTIVYLCELGFAMKDALKIYNVYNNNTIPYLEHNIYRIVDEVDDITFNKIDKLFTKFNISPTDERRIKACIHYIMQVLINNTGNTYLNYQEILNGVIKYLNIIIDDSEFGIYLNELQLESKIVVEEDKYYLKEVHDAEINIVNKIKTLKNLPKTKYKNLDSYINYLEEGNDITYNDMQKEAIIKALENNIVVITGGPGTGKTTIIKAIVELYKKLNKLSDDQLNDALCLLAPTGRASKRMSESTLMPAMTIHRFLKWNKESNQFGINEYNKDMSKLIIIDEVSMIDINLLDNLFKGLTDNIKLVLVGDYHQLPSVGPGQILKDIIESKCVDTIYLNMLYRQDENSYITTLAHEINTESLSENFLEPHSDYKFLECSSRAIINSLNNICNQIIDKGYDYKQVQIMAPMYRGENGIDNLNKKLQQVFNPKDDSKKEISHGDVIFRENDKVLQLVNMPDENVFNGDIGIIKNIVMANTSSSGKNEVHVDFDGTLVKYYNKDLIKLKHGFIVSIHKSQGSEFEIVIMPIASSYQRMLFRKLIYTGITRAKRKLILLGEPKAFIYGINNNNEYLRKTDLLNKLVYNLK
jgi:exodeoxyribonuclease V alpha subunit